MHLYEMVSILDKTNFKTKIGSLSSYISPFHTSAELQNMEEGLPN